MQIEILLANLLFGLTILTGAIALAHLVGDILLGQRNYNPKLRVAIRSLVVCFAITVCLAFYLYLLGQPGRTELSVFVTKVRPYLPAGYLIAHGENANSKGGDKKTTIQEYATVGTEQLPRSIESRLQSYLMPGSEPMLFSFRPRFDAAEDLPYECADWLVQLDALSADSSLSANPNDKIDVFCAGAGADHAQWRVFSQARAALVVGAVGETPHVDLSVFASSWGTQPSGDIAVAFTGWDVLSTPLPFGLRLFFGRDWISKPGILAQTDEQEMVVAVDDRWRPKSGANAALVKRNVGGRRLIWTSLPATLHGKLRFSYDAYWILLKQHMHGWLSGIPGASPALDPTGKSGAVISLSSSVDATDKQDDKLDHIFVQTTDGSIGKDPPKANVRGVKFVGNLVTLSRHALLRGLHQSGLNLRDDDTKWTVLDIQDQSLLAPALSLGFDAVIQPAASDRLVPQSMQIKHLKKGESEATAPAGSQLSSVLVLKGPSVAEAQGGIALGQVPVKSLSISMAPHLRYGEQEPADEVLPLSEYLNYMRVRSNILIQPGRRDGRNFWQVVNLGTEHVKNLVLHYHEKGRVRVVGSPLTQVSTAEVGDSVGSLTLAGLKPGEAVLLEWVLQ